MLSCRFCYKLRRCPKLTLSVEFILSVRLALNGPNMLTSFCGTKKEINNHLTGLEMTLLSCKLGSKKLWFDSVAN